MNAIILKHEMPIDAALAKSLIKKYGAAHMMVNDRARGRGTEPGPRRVKLQLRPYQEQGVADIRAQFAAGEKSVLYVLPTGGGKTVTYSHIAEQAGLRQSPEPVDVEDIEPTDVFKVLINYGNGVVLLLESDSDVVEITLRLAGVCEERVEDGVLLPAEWHAVAEL